MTRIAWDVIGERYYETGVDRGVLYVGTAAGVPWNGLISITENPVGGEAKEYYQDGVKYYSITASEEFGASIEAYTYPEAFAACDGTKLVRNGLYAGQQNRVPFGLSYRSMIGNDIKGDRLAYKIHVVYGAVAAPSSKARTTQGENVEPTAFTWEITTSPKPVLGLRPTAHFEIDSRKVPSALLTLVERLLYGGLNAEPRLPTPQELYDLFNNYVPDIPQPEDTPPTTDPITSLDGAKPGTTAANTYDGGSPSSTHDTTIDGGTQ